MSQPALDKMVAIADAFDGGAFAGMSKVDTDTVARLVGLPSKSVSRLLNRLGVRQLTPGKSVKERPDRIYEYPSRIRLPDAEKIRQPEARLVVEAIADHRLPRAFNTRLLYHRLGYTLNGGTIGVRGHLPKPFHEALLRSGFTSHRPEGFKSKAIWRPATWEPPRDREDWPQLFQEQRRLRQHGVRASTIYRHTDSAAGLDGIIRDAVQQLDLSRIPYDQWGALKGQIHRVIRQGYSALLAVENDAMRTNHEDADMDVDWQAVSLLNDGQLRNFAKIAARVATSETANNPGAYALRWVQENSLSVGTDGVSVNGKSNEHVSAV